jgi:hypothetical protein
MRSPTELIKSLQVGSGDRLLLINVPRQIAEELTAGAEVEPVRLGEAHSGAIAFCGGREEAAAYASQALDGLEADGLLWFAYREGAEGLGRDSGWDTLTDAGYELVGSIAFDDGWTGLRFRRKGRDGKGRD